MFHLILLIKITVLTFGKFFDGLIFEFQISNINIKKSVLKNYTVERPRAINRQDGHVRKNLE